MTAPTLTQAAAPTSAFPCPSWCEGDCNTGWYDEEGSLYHGSAYANVKAAASGHPNIDLSTSVTRLDFPDVMGTPEVHILANPSTDLILTPANARKAAAMLLNAADMAEPLPAGVVHIPAEEIRIGYEIDTPDGWQTAYMILVDARDQHVSIFTNERDDSYTDGWQYTFGDPLIVRRPQVARQRRREVRR